MRFVPALAAASALCITGAATSLTAQSAPTSIFQAPERPWVIDGFDVPPIADTFALVEVTRYQVVELGFGLVYSGPLQRNLDLTIYVYPIRDDVEDPLAWEMSRALSEINRYAETRRPAWAVSEVSEGHYAKLLDDGTSLDGLMLQAEYLRSGQTARTFAFVFEREGYVLKYRITYNADAREDLWEYLDRWMLETASTIRPRNPGERGGPRDGG